MSYPEEFIPPPEDIFVGSGAFREIGENYVNLFINMAGLKPHHNVLDVGCGIGRMASPLTQYLNQDAVYEGFDVVPKGIEWCNQKIKPRYPNFGFQLADLHNSHYNPNSSTNSSDYKFPYEDGSFDFVFLTSVFTHMLHEGLENYLSEIERVLSEDGILLATYFLRNPESSRLINTGKSRFSFSYPTNSDKCRAERESSPETVVSYDEDYIFGLYEKHGFQLSWVSYGSWCGRESPLTKGGIKQQDIVIAKKGK
jgi:SAM-dependent methyltransferase